ncbi:MAG: hypothetical protein JSR79_05105 [Proteobacteria bacterium]|nr:hypothetical protein [Pseudomonadota bacterium]
MIGAKMQFSTLKNCIRSSNQQNFYDVALLFLASQSFQDLNVVDGAGDGGQDVTCSIPGLRIQLSVQRKWEKKIRDEVKKTRDAGKHHFVYVTSQLISPSAEQTFLKKYSAELGGVLINIHDANKIASALTISDNWKRAYQVFGLSPVGGKIDATLNDVAISTLMVFGSETAQIRERLVEAAVKFEIKKRNPACEADIVLTVSESLYAKGSERSVKSAISRLRSSGQVYGPVADLKLEAGEAEKTTIAIEELQTSRQLDVRSLSTAASIDESLAEQVFELALPLISEAKYSDAVDARGEAFASFLSENGMNRKRDVIYRVLSEGATAQRFRFSSVVNRVLATNTLDLFKSLGQRTDISVVLDASVALPMLFGLEFKDAKSRYGIAAAGLRVLCENHSFSMVVPQEYLNEIASHGRLALKPSEFYHDLPDQARASLRASENAYLSHYTHIFPPTADGQPEISFSEFLEHFGIKEGRPVRKIELRIREILESHGVSVMKALPHGDAAKSELKKLKPWEVEVLIDHDAAVCDFLNSDSERGYLLATWDRSLIRLFEGTSRVFVGHPGTIIDILTVAQGMDYSVDQDFELLSYFMHIEDEKIRHLAEKVSQIRDQKQAFRLRRFIDDIGNGNPRNRTLTVDNLDTFLATDSAP